MLSVGCADVALERGWGGAEGRIVVAVESVGRGRGGAEGRIDVASETAGDAAKDPGVGRVNAWRASAFAMPCAYACAQIFLVDIFRFGFLGRFSTKFGALGR